MAKKMLAKKTKEQVYDSVIRPLMTTILETCREHKIAMVASFGLDNDGLMCTSFLLEPDYSPPDAIIRAAKETQRTPGFMAFTVTSGD